MQKHKYKNQLLSLGSVATEGTKDGDRGLPTLPQGRDSGEGTTEVEDENHILQWYQLEEASLSKVVVSVW